MAGRRRHVRNSVTDKIRNDILNGKYKHGTFLPPERTLSVELGVGRSTLRAALKDLVEENIIKVNPGRGMCVSTRPGKNLFSRILVCAKSQNITKSLEMTRILAGICEQASNYNAEVVIDLLSSALPVNNLIDRYVSGDIHGLIFLEECDNDDYHIPLSRASVPHVVANLEFDINVCAARMNYRAVGRAAARYLINNGHRKLGVISRQLQGKRNIYREMLAGFKGELAEEDLSIVKDHIVELPTEPLDAIRACADYLRGKKDDLPTAMFCMRDKHAATLYRACHCLNIAIPAELSVISFDDISWENAKSVGLTTIRQCPEEIGRAAVTMLEKWTRTREIPADEMLQGELVERNSCLPLGDMNVSIKRKMSTNEVLLHDLFVSG